MEFRNKIEDWDQILGIGNEIGEEFGFGFRIRVWDLGMGLGI